ncbi:amylo-alpha-1,6-glucosidase [Chitinophaga sp.]|uniref:amylo-alpha-1,6-glucosidase n=1 Tax=Chitinophaga sp. TaxID=1869181 RepID=UPI002C5D17D6|nr:amylo-alpha-1,6-glucosidase [Chitinophaga sp.]HWV64400.1 amylo-alpha-1,6-glucosidase [Chitinophaga sp.]
MQLTKKIQSLFGDMVLEHSNMPDSREVILSGNNGTYAATTLSGYNSRKYHGLFVAPQPQLDDDNHVLLSSLDESVLSDGQTWLLGAHCYHNTFYPEGFHHICTFNNDYNPTWTYRFGNMLLIKEWLFLAMDNTLYIKYTLKEADAAVTLHLMPLLAFRNMHTLTHRNSQLNGTVVPVTGGISVQLYPGYTPLYLQTSAQANFITDADWYYNFSYPEEQEKGYDYQEDLYTPGYFELKIEPGQTVLFAIGVKATDIKMARLRITHLLKELNIPETICDYLRRSARRFIIEKDKRTIIKAGYYWFGSWGRDTCISLPGLTLLTGEVYYFRKIADTLLKDMKQGIIPNTGYGSNAIYNTADASLWLIWAMQQYVKYYITGEKLWEIYGAALATIMEYYRQGTLFGIRMEEDGLIYAGEAGYALTWMDAIVDNQPVTPRYGKAVEINALWYNAVCFCLQIATEAGDQTFVKKWAAYPERIRNSFVDSFWSDERKYLADHVSDSYKDWSVRPNQLFAVSLPFSPLTGEQQKAVMDKIRGELLTPRGLRTLSSSDADYHAHYCGTQPARDMTYHQGTVWPWMLAHFAEGYLRVYKHEGLRLLEEIYDGLAPALKEDCLYSVAEVFDGDFPHKAGGAVAQAWSVAELLRFRNLLNNYK